MYYVSTTQCGKNETPKQQQQKKKPQLFSRALKPSAYTPGNTGPIPAVRSLPPQCVVTAPGSAGTTDTKAPLPPAHETIPHSAHAFRGENKDGYLPHTIFGNSAGSGVLPIPQLRLA